MKQRFPKAARLLKSYQFRSVGRTGQRAAGNLILVTYRLTGQANRPRLGITVSKKYGKAVQRNRFKRIARAAFQSCPQCLPEGVDIILRPRSAAQSAKSTAIAEELLRLVVAVAHQEQEAGGPSQ